MKCGVRTRKRRKLFKCKYCGLSVNYMKGHIRTFHRKQYPMKEKEEKFFEGPGTCCNCGKEKMVHFVKHGHKWRDICDSCEQLVAPYLKPGSDKKPRKIGNISI